MRRSFGLAIAFLGLLVIPQSASSQAVTYNSVRLNWTAVGDDSLTGTANTYDIRYSTNPITLANWASATQVSGEPAPLAPGTSQSFTVTGLQPNTLYYFGIRTADEVPNWSGLSNVISRTTLAAPDTIRPAPVTNLAVTGVTGNNATLAWTAVGDDSLTGTAASYDIRYSTSPITAANWAAATQATGEPSPLAPGTSQSFTVTGLNQQTLYYFAIRVADDAGNLSAMSNVPSGTTLDVTAPAAITNLAVGWIWLGGTGGVHVERPVALGPTPRSGRAQH
jgi:hypothetical protein